MVNPVPDNHPRAGASLAEDGAAGAIDFCVAVSGARERIRFDAPDEMQRRVRELFGRG